MNDKPMASSAETCGRAVHTDPEVQPTPEQEPLPHAIAKQPVETKSAAEWAYQRLIPYLQHFEKQLDQEHEVIVSQLIQQRDELKLKNQALSAQVYIINQTRTSMISMTFNVYINDE